MNQETTRTTNAPCLGVCSAREQPETLAFPDSDPMEDVVSQVDSWLYSSEMTCEDVNQSIKKLTKNQHRWKRVITLAIMALKAQAKIEVVKSNKSVNAHKREKERGQILSQLGEEYVTESQFDKLVEEMNLTKSDKKKADALKTA